MIYKHTLVNTNSSCRSLMARFSKRRWRYVARSVDTTVLCVTAWVRPMNSPSPEAISAELYIIRSFIWS